MTLSLKPYPEYKESGLPWLGKIPVHWEVFRNGRLFEQRNQTGFSDLPILEVSLRTGVRIRDFENNARKQVMSDREKYKRAVRGDVAYNMMRMWQGAVGVAPADGLVSPAYVVARPFPGTESSFFTYLFRTKAYMDEVDKYSHGIVKDRNRLYWEDFKQMPSLVPPTEEQKHIAAFLDGYGRIVGRLIRAKRRLIELLNEQKQVIIHRAVTRGLDPNVRLKPSGIEWLGDVPADWEIASLRRFANSRCDGPFGSGLKSIHYAETGIRVIRLQNIGHAQFRDDDQAYISEEHYSTLGDHSVLARDLLIAGLGDDRIPAGRSCVAPQHVCPAMVKADCFRFRLKQDRIVPQFMAFQLSSTARAAAAILSTGATRQRVNLQSMSGRGIAVPPLPVQEEIVIRLTNEIKPFDAAIRSTLGAIDLLREYRTLLIADVVTGKLDVRGVELPTREEADSGDDFDAGEETEFEDMQEQDLDTSLGEDNA
jgi:type I restriction enzyme S subunit